jgi:hypothetical protein
MENSIKDTKMYVFLETTQFLKLENLLVWQPEIFFCQRMSHDLS